MLIMSNINKKHCHVFPHYYITRPKKLLHLDVFCGVMGKFELEITKKKTIFFDFFCSRINYLCGTLF